MERVPKLRKSLVFHRAYSFLWNLRTGGEVGMSERPKKRMVQFIESYWTGGELGSDYQWNDNHGELIRCKDCKYWLPMNRFHQDYHPGNGECELNRWVRQMDWFCADGERKEKEKSK